MLGRAARLAALAVLTAVGLSALLVVMLRWVPPPTTAFILQHRLANWEAGRPTGYRWVGWDEMSPELAVAVIAAGQHGVNCIQALNGALGVVFWFGDLVHAPTFCAAPLLATSY